MSVIFSYYFYLALFRQISDGMNMIYRMLRATRILSISLIPSINLKNVFVHLAAQFRLMVLGIALARFFEIKKSNAERICVHLRLSAVNSVLLMLVLNHYQRFLTADARR